MSSTFHILCLSHDPAITITGPGYNRPAEAEAAIRDSDHGHPDCDLLIARYSGGLIELGCPTPGDQPRAHQHQCWQHRATEWVDVAWLRILAIARIARVLPSEAVSSYHFKCWPDTRLNRLRRELALELTDEQP